MNLFFIIISWCCISSHIRVRSDNFRSAKKGKKSEISARKFSFHAEKFPTFQISILCIFIDDTFLMNSLNGMYPVLNYFVNNRPSGQQSATIISDLQHAFNKYGLAFQSIINIIIERKPFNKGSTTTTTTVSTMAGIKHFFSSIFF